MNKLFKKILILLATMQMIIAMTPLAIAQGTILPKADNGFLDCNTKINYFNQSGKFTIPEDESATLGCAITTGRISLTMVPFFIKYFSNYLLGMVSLVALLFVVIGGFMYSAGGLTGQKDKGKTFITNALTGMVIAFLAWSIVNVILAAITG